MNTVQLPLLESETTLEVGSADVHSVKEPAAAIRIAMDAGHVFDAIHSIFPTQQEENRLQKARQVMGDEVKDLTDEDLEVYLTEFNFLLDAWMDEFERTVFNNKTLQQVLREG
jgi:hypothetical protein